jgi:hypothetical protein
MSATKGRVLACQGWAAEAPNLVRPNWAGPSWPRSFLGSTRRVLEGIYMGLSVGIGL